MSGEWRVASGEGSSTSPAIRSYRDLQVWKFSLAWTECVYRASQSWPRDERFGLTSQVRRAAVSVGSNIAEGAARKTRGEFLQFIGIARGSLAEAETQLILAHRLGFMPQGELDQLLAQSEEINRMLAGLNASLKRTQ